MPLLEALKEIKRIGLSEKEKEVVNITDEPKYFSYLCFPNIFANGKYYTENSFGQGYNPDKNLAKIKSIAEYLERLSIDNPNKSSFIESVYQYSEDFARPSDFVCYSNEQINRQKFLQEADKSKYRWIKSNEILTEKEVYIPAQMVFLSKLFDDEFQLRGERITTGTSFGKNIEKTLESAILEVVERDACIGHYLMKQKILKIKNLPESSKDLVDYLERYRLYANIFDVTSDLEIPTAMCITLDKTGIGGAVNIGSKSSWNMDDAINGSILESIQCRRLARITNKTRICEGKINSLEDRFFYWHNVERIGDLDFWLNDSSEIDFNEIGHKNINFSFAIEEFRKRNYRIFEVDIALQEIKEKEFNVSRVVIPELHPMYLNEDAKMLYSKHYGKIPDLKLKPHPLT